MIPIRPAAICLAVALLLAGCDAPGTGGQPAQSLPYAQAGVAVAETAAVATQAAYAMSYSSTANAVNAASTAAAAQVTAVAESTATAQTEWNSAAAIGMMTKDAIEAHTLQAEATATAVHLQWLVDYDARKAVNQQRTAEWWHWFRIVGLVLFAAIGWVGGLKWFIPAIYEWMVPSVRDKDGNTLAVRAGYKNQPLPPVAPVEIDDYQEPPEDAPVYETLVSVPSGTFTAKSPTPGDFVNWLGAVLDNPRAEFSNNQRKARGWKETYYWGLITDMKRVGWLHSKPDPRGCYTMTAAGEQQARTWLENR